MQVTQIENLIRKQFMLSNANIKKLERIKTIRCQCG